MYRPVQPAMGRRGVCDDYDEDRPLQPLLGDAMRRDGIVCVGRCWGWEHNSMGGRVYSPQGLSPTLCGVSKVSGYTLGYIRIIHEAG